MMSNEECKALGIASLVARYEREALVYSEYYGDWHYIHGDGVSEHHEKHLARLAAILCDLYLNLCDYLRSGRMVSGYYAQRLALAERLKFDYFETLCYYRQSTDSVIGL